MSIKRQTGVSDVWAVAVALGLGATLFLAGCNGSSQNAGNGSQSGGQPTGSASTEPFKVTINSWIGFAPLYIAKEKGIFTKNGVDVELVSIEDTGARKSSMMSNKVDAYGVSVDGAALDTAQGGPAHLVMAFDQSNGADGIIAKNSIKTIQDLKGRTVAVQPGLPGQFLLNYVLAKNGLKPTDIKTIDMDSDKAGAAFAAGKVDVAVTWEPWLSQSSQHGGHKLITSAQLPGVIVDTLGLTDEAESQKSAQAKEFVRSWFEALDYLKAHPAESASIMGKATKLTNAQVKDYLAGVKFLSLPENKAYFGTKEKPGPISEIFRMAGQSWKANGIITNPSNPADHIDPSIVQSL